MLSIKVRTPKEVLSLSLAESSTFEVLKIEIAEKGNIDSDFDVLAGFPLKPLTLQDEDIIYGHINNNEVLRIQAKELAGHQSQGQSKYRPSKSSKITPKNSESVTTSTQPRSSKTKAGAVASSPSSGAGFGARIATLHSSSSNRKAPPSSRVHRPAGFTVFAPAGANVPARRTRVRQATRPRASGSSSNENGGGTTESDIAEHLINAVSGGSSRRDKILRKVFRNAVEYQYSSSKAVARLQSVYAQTYTTTPSSQARILGSGMSSQLNVTYPRGGGQRGDFTETVELLGEELLKALMKVAVEDTEGEGREVLKPMNLARCSPRIFWSIIHRYGPNLIDSIRRLLVGIDDECMWLTERKRDLSEKAKENALQEQQRVALREMRKRKRDGISVDLDEADVTSKEGTQQNLSKPEAAPASSVSSSASSAVASTLSIPNSLREIFSSLPLSLAITVQDDKLLSIIETYLQEQYQVMYSPGDTSSSSSSADIPWLFILANIRHSKQFHQRISSQYTSIEIDQLDLWISSAQHFLLQRLWQVVCGGGSERLRLALQSIRIRNPLEILLWRSAPGGLYNGLLQYDGGLAQMSFTWPMVGSSESVNLASSWSVDHVRFMIQVCQAMQSLCPWLGDYDRIVVEDDEESDEDMEDGTNDGAVVENEKGQEENAVGFEDWSTEDSCHPYLGKRVRVIVRGGDSDSDEDEPSDEQDEDDEQQQAGHEIPLGSYWEEGTVVGYLPPTEEEPMALWRIRIDEKLSSTASSTKSPQCRYEDMEQEEVELAMERFVV